MIQYIENKSKCEHVWMRVYYISGGSSGPASATIPAAEYRCRICNEKRSEKP